MEFKKFSNKIAVEQLVFKVKKEKVDEFIELDQKIWTEELAKWPGFLGKEIWISESTPVEIITTVYWRSLKEWKSIDHEKLRETDQKFKKALGENNFELYRELHNEKQFFKVAEYK